MLPLQQAVENYMFLLVTGFAVRIRLPRRHEEISERRSGTTLRFLAFVETLPRELKLRSGPSRGMGAG
jgi:hypothetical protein